MENLQYIMMKITLTLILVGIASLVITLWTSKL